MMVKRLIAAALPLALTGCFIAPGQFTSTLDLRRSGQFTFGYQGEVVFQAPDEMFGQMDGARASWSDDQASCTDKPPLELPRPKAMQEPAKPPVVAPPAPPTAPATKREPGKVETPEAEEDADLADVLGKPRDCTKAEIAEQKAAWEADRKAAAAKRAEDAKQFGTLFGYIPGDEASNRRFAALLMKYEGYRSVVYKGDGVFQVDYQASGTLDHDFVFPLLPQSEIVFPFLTLKRQSDGSVRMTAPSLIGGGLKAIGARLQALGREGGGKLSPPEAKLKSMTRGTFTITTDGEVRTNNTEDGAARVASGRQLVWEVGPDSEKIPEALIGLR